MSRFLLSAAVLVGVLAGHLDPAGAAPAPPVVARWRCSEPIEVRVNVEHWRGPGDPVALVGQAVAELRRLTNLPLDFRGATVQSWYEFSAFTGDRAIIVEWFPEELHPGQWGWANVYRAPDGWEIVGASVALTNAVPTPLFVVMHELGHTVGLEHSEASEGLMAVGAPDPRYITHEDRLAFRRAGCPDAKRPRHPKAAGRWSEGAYAARAWRAATSTR